jgi:hypothetical protein
MFGTIWALLNFWDEKGGDTGAWDVTTIVSVCGTFENLMRQIARIFLSKLCVLNAAHSQMAA